MAAHCVVSPTGCSGWPASCRSGRWCSTLTTGQARRCRTGHPLVRQEWPCRCSLIAPHFASAVYSPSMLPGLARLFCASQGSTAAQPSGHCKRRVRGGVTALWRFQKRSTLIKPNAIRHVTDCRRLFDVAGATRTSRQPAKARFRDATQVSRFGWSAVSPSRPAGHESAARSSDQDWPQAIAGGGAKRS